MKEEKEIIKAYYNMNFSSSKKLKLTNAQFKVTALIANGEGAKGTAKILFNSVRTIETHLSKIKLINNIRNTAELTKEFVLQYGDPHKYLDKIKQRENIIRVLAGLCLSVQILAMVLTDDIDMRRPRRTRRVSHKVTRKK